MATIHSLAAETLYSIFEQGADPVPRTSGSWKVLHQNYAFFRSIMLVLKQWWSTSESLIWKHLFVYREKRAKLMLESAAFGRHRVHTLKIDGGMKYKVGVRAESCQRLLSTLEGVKDLFFSKFDKDAGLTFELLSSPNLKELSFLSIDEVFLHSPISPATFAATSLTSLMLSEYTSDSSTPYTFFSTANELDYLRFGGFKVTEPFVPLIEGD